jgi:hypothetical protein
MVLIPIAVSSHVVPLILRLWCGPRAFGIELCENGLVASTSFTPWTAIRGYHWNSQGRLVVQYRFLRCEVHVDPTDRETVARIFQEHVKPSTMASAVGKTGRHCNQAYEINLP